MTEADRNLLVGMFDAAIAAADPGQALKNVLPPPPKGRTIVVGAGKGAAQMAAALEKLWREAENGSLQGAVVTRYGFGVKCQNIEVLEASHPVPDENGLAAANRLKELVTGLSREDLVIALVCGGGSALLPSPPEGFSLADEQGLNETLLASGAPISAMNAIRKQFSTIKGGRLAEMAYPARVVTLVVSDVPGDDPAQVASGPTVPDRSDARQALAHIANYRMEIPKAILDHIAQSVAPLPDDPKLVANTVEVIASARISLNAAAELARQNGLNAVILSDAIEGESSEIARMHGAIAREVARFNQPLAKPAVLLSGGETTVTMKGKGKGGRNTEFLLSLAREIEGEADIVALAADTDGIDGSEDNAGAFADGTTVLRLRQAGLDAAAMLGNNDAWTAFDALGDLFVPGPTGTNINDFRAIMVRDGK